MKRSPIKRTVRISERNAKRAAAKFRRNYRCLDRVLYGNLGRCYVCGQGAHWNDPIQNAHYLNRGMGGCGGDYLKVIPMHASEHWIQEENAHFFEERGLDPAELAARFQNAWVEYARRNGIEP